MSEFNFEDFKIHLSSFLKDNFNACDSFTEQIKKAKDTVEIRRIVRQHKDEIAENIGAFCEELERLEELKDEVKELEQEISYLTNKPVSKISLEEEYKMEAFHTHKDEYRLEDFELLLKHGNEMLKSFYEKRNV